MFFFSRFVYTRTFTRGKACKITRQWESTFINFHFAVVSSLVFADPGNSQLRTHVQIDKEVSDFVCNFLDSVFVALELAMKI